MECLRRELHEEVGGLKLIVGDYLGVIDHTWRNAAGYSRAMQHFFIASASELSSKETPPMCQMDGIEFEWLDLERLASSELKPPSLGSRVLDWKNSGTKGWSLVDVEA